jgi:hypothetical protein
MVNAARLSIPTLDDIETTSKPGTLFVFFGHQDFNFSADA